MTGCGSVSEVARAGVQLLQGIEGRRAALLESVREAEAEGERDGFLTLEEVEADVRRAISEATAKSR